jgi:transcriptional regulator with XRE-family HTH domain
LDKTITNKIKVIRQNQKITLKSLAEKTGLTEGYLSKIENSENAPPISTLRRIATALGFDVSYFFLPHSEDRNNNPNIEINRANNSIDKRFSARPLEENEYGYDYMPLALNKKGKNMEPYKLFPDFEPGGVIQTKGEYFMYVLTGSIEFFYGTHKYSFSQGDSAYFDGHIPFQAKSIGKEKAKLLVIIYPYTRS